MKPGRPIVDLIADIVRDAIFQQLSAQDGALRTHVAAQEGRAPGQALARWLGDELDHRATASVASVWTGPVVAAKNLVKELEERL